MTIQQTLLLCFIPEQALPKIATMPDIPHVAAVWDAVMQQASVKVRYALFT